MEKKCVILHKMPGNSIQGSSANTDYLKHYSLAILMFFRRPFQNKFNLKHVTTSIVSFLQAIVQQFDQQDWQEKPLFSEAFLGERGKGGVILWLYVYQGVVKNLNQDNRERVEISSLYHLKLLIFFSINLLYSTLILNRDLRMSFL